MPSSRPSHRGTAFILGEYLFLGAVILGWAIMVIAAGKDWSWDFRNYHWYIPYAFLEGRLGFDVAVAHQATYYNPVLDVPFYFLATHAHAWFALGMLGAVQGSNIVPLYAMARSTLVAEKKRTFAAILACVCMTGSLTIHLAGTTYYDNVMSVLVLSSLALAVTQRDMLREGPAWKGAAVAGLSGLLVGSAVGLKLPEAPFALGLAATLLILPGDWRRRLTRLLAAGTGGIAGVAIFAGFWMSKVAHLTGNPLFPYFNEYFHSPLALHASYRDMRFIPKKLEHQLLFPLLFSIDWRIADDLPFQDIRVGEAYLLLLAVPIVRIFGMPEKEIIDRRAFYALAGFAGIAYVAWLKVFAIYRYILLLEMLAPFLIIGAVALWPISQRARLVVCGSILLVTLATMKTTLVGRMPVNDPYIQVSLPPIPRPDRTMILMTGNEPLGYIAPSIPRQIPILRIDGWLMQPDDASQMTARTRARVNAFTGDFYVVFSESEAARNRDALKSYGLAIDAPKCRNIVTNLSGLYRFCPATRITAPS